MNATVSAGSENCLALGTRLADFEITGILGEGGFGIVYLAFDHSLQRTVAVKEYMPGALAARGADQGVTMRAERHRETFNVGLKSFINEARFLAQFDHPSLVKVHRFWEQNQTAYTAMQYYDGRTVKDIVENSPELVDEAWCARIVRQILAALEMLYTMRILHRDVSPDNIIVQQNGDAVLLDFGSARQLIGDMNQELTVILKPGYAPVEQYAGDAVYTQGAFTDIYALSAVMYFAILGIAPPSSIARMILDQVAPLAGRALPGYSGRFLHAIDRGLAVQAQDRPQTIEAFRALLGIAAPPAPPMRPAGASPRLATIATAGAGRPAIPLEAAANPAPPDAPDRPATAPASMPKRVALARRWPALGALGVLLAAAIVYAAFLRPADNLMIAASQTRQAPSKQAAAASAYLTDDADAAASAAPAARANAAAPVPVPVPAPQRVPAQKPAAAPPSAPAPVAPKTDLPVAPKSEAPAPETASYRLAVKPWGNVYVDGKLRGVTPPLKKLLLAAGRHQIRVVNPGFPDYLTEVALQKDKSGTIEHDFAAGKKETP